MQCNGSGGSSGIKIFSCESATSSPYNLWASVQAATNTGGEALQDGLDEAFQHGLAPPGVGADRSARYRERARPRVCATWWRTWRRRISRRWGLPRWRGLPRWISRPFRRRLLRRLRWLLRSVLLGLSLLRIPLLRLSLLWLSALLRPGLLLRLSRLYVRTGGIAAPVCAGAAER